MGNGKIISIRIPVKRLINRLICLGTICGSDVKAHQRNRIRKLTERMVNMSVGEAASLGCVMRSVKPNIGAQQKQED